MPSGEIRNMRCAQTVQAKNAVELQKNGDIILHMEIQTQSRILRAMRAWTGFDQSEVAARADLAERTLLDAERGRSCSQKTWDKLLGFYAQCGLYWRAGDDVEPARLVFRG